MPTSCTITILITTFITGSLFYNYLPIMYDTYSIGTSKSQIAG